MRDYGTAYRSFSLAALDFASQAAPASPSIRK
jgi:hypothetical protein